MPSGYASSGREGSMRPCRVCGIENYYYPSELKISKNFYCSAICRGTTMKGEQSPAYKDGRCSDPAKYNRVYKAANRDKYAFATRHRYYFKRASGTRHTLAEWRDLVERTGNKCLACGMSGEQVRLTEDHIVPLSIGGDNSITNIQPLCKSCNSKKHTKIIDYSHGRNC